jgi:signal transduction histidine kinase
MSKKVTEKASSTAKIRNDDFNDRLIHDLQTPLTVIIGSLYTALDDGISEEDKRHLLQNAVEAAESLSKKLDDLQKSSG